MGETRTKVEEIGTIVAIDPGEHNGICVLLLYKGEAPWGKTSDALTGYSVQKLEFTTFEGDDEFIDGMCKTLHLYAKHSIPTIVVCEHFVFTRVSSMGGSRAAVEMTGALKAIIKLMSTDSRRIRLFTDQKPADAKLISNSVLEQLDIKRRGDKSTDHAQMAARHGVTAAIRIKKNKIRLV